MKKNKKIKIIITLAIVIAFLWFLVLSPMITFHKNEEALKKAAVRYFELNPSELPTGERVKTLSLNTLYHKALLKSDLYIPYTHKICSIDNSWVKVRKVDGIYKYYTYLECGLLSSNIDHKGPSIQLKGDSEIILGKGEEFNDPGVKSVIDNVDGSMDISKVEIKSTIDSSRIGTYEVTYTAYDNLRNKTVQTRTVTVVQKLYNTMKEILGEATNFKGEPDNNFLRLSNMLYRVYGVDSDNNVIIVQDEDISNVNYSQIDKWLDYYYKQLNEKTQKLIVENKYCNMSVTENNLATTSCNSYTKKRKVYLPSIVEINNATSGTYNFMKPYTLSWVANAKEGENKAYVTRNIFYAEDSGKLFVSYDVDDNYGIRPMMTIKGDALITAGSGTETNPYVFDDVVKAKDGDYINTRYTGEYVSINGDLYRIVKVEKDGTTKVIAEKSVGKIGDAVKFNASSDSDIITYDPKDKTSIAYFINNRVSEYVDTSYFVNHEIEVPICKDKIIYGKEVETKKYKVKLSAPNMYELFSAQPQRNLNTMSYWLINSSNGNRITGAISDIGVPLNQEIPNFGLLYVRVVGFLRKTAIIGTGNGTLESPYIVK